MSTVIDAAVSVTLAANGDPATFIWDRFEYVIVGQPRALFTRTAWWRDAESPARIDTELWRVDAVRDDDEPTRYDLRRDADGRWTLAIAWT